MKRYILLAGTQPNWTPPDGLDRSRPRPVRLTGGGKALLSLAVVLLVGSVVAGVGLWTVAGRDAQIARLFREDGVDADALVTRLWRLRQEGGRTLVAYRFTASGKIYEVESRIPRRTWQNLQVGSPLPIRYVQSNPAFNYPRAYGRRGAAPWLPFVVGAGIAACGVLILLPLLRQHRLLANGRAALGHVTRHRDEQHGKKYYYEFHLLSGATAKGESGPSKKPPAIGSTFCVLYDPETPRTNSPYPLSLVRVA